MVLKFLARSLMTTVKLKHLPASMFRGSGNPQTSDSGPKDESGDTITSKGDPVT